MATIHIIISIIGILSWILWALTNKDKRLFAVAPISVFLHVIIFYVVRLTLGVPNPLGVPRAESVFLRSWSAAVRIHMLTLLTLASIIMAWEHIQIWIKQLLQSLSRR